ncbi:MAG: saccharopine dehydrogenase NADP-binding domain-containing protein [Proteobacteria bacterium]|nr:saccharopine dehydrogenase NADP-binding domain-containing protein [Pseudomonadota bacterium]
MSTPRYDLVLWGATGFTGKLTAEYLLRTYGATEPLGWALGGRNREKLERTRDELSAETGIDAGALPLFVGNGDDDASMAELAESARVVCTTVGPYARYGSGLVAACARAGTHYCDLTGEVHWMRRMIDAHEDTARKSGARIVHTCGFDCIPSDVGTWFVQREMQRRYGAPAEQVHLRVVSFAGGFSGGTLASMLNMVEEARHDPEVMRSMGAPYSLNPKDVQTGPDRSESLLPAYDRAFGQWTAPFVMAGVNTKIVRRTNALTEFSYGRGFRYDEAILTGGGPLGMAKAAGAAAAQGGGMAATTLAPVRRMLARRMPPGAGPSKAQREAGHFDLRLLAQNPNDPSQRVHARVRGDRDPGYGSTSKMLGEAAVCLAQDELGVGGGFWTPAAAMGDLLLERLPAKAGVTFEIEEPHA